MFLQINSGKQTQMNNSLTKVILLAFLLAFASGCSWSKKDKEPKQKALTDYRESREISALEIPPDLSSDAAEKSLTVPKYQQQAPAVDAGQKTTKVVAAGSASATSESQTASSKDSEGVPKMYIERAGSQRWLVIYQSYSEAWSDARDFLLSSGLALEREDKEAGILETTWAENYATDVLRGSQKLLNKWLGTIYAKGGRDKFRLRVEPGRIAGTSEIYLTHKGMIEKVVSDNGVDAVQTVWEATPPDANIEAEMLAKLMVALGATEATASTSVVKADKSADRASITKDANGQAGLIVNDGIDTAWRRVGQTLDRVGFSVEDRDISKRVYFVRYADPELNNKKPGFFSKMFKKNKKSYDDDIYQILLTEEGEKTAVDVAAKDGTAAPENVSTQIIKLLYEQLR
jgi:outer membrane protein assembly factor BamC